MKTFVPSKQLIRFAFTVLFISYSCWNLAKAQLVFENVTQRSGQAGADNSTYTFPYVDGVNDAIVKISGRSSSLVTLSNIDLTSSGFSKAFQPQVSYNGGSVTGAASWWMEFEIKFVGHNTSSPVTIPSVYATGLDIDGDNGALREFNIFYSPNYFVTENNSSLSLSSIIGNLLQITAAGKKFSGVTTDYSGIDTTRTNVMVTNVYSAVNTITVRVGASTTGSSSSTNRMHSIWFKSFSFNTPLSTLPVKLASFTATLNNNKADLKWTTASEINTNYFMIERSTNGTDYADAGMVFAFGNTVDMTSYSFSDNLSGIQSDVVYYRLRSVDNDGKSQYSDTRIIRLSKQANNSISLSAYPNPVANELRVTIPGSWQNKAVAFEVYSVNGKLVSRVQTASSSQTEIINTSSLQSGLYFVKAICGNEAAQQKIVKQ